MEASVKIAGGKAFSYLEVTLAPQCEIFTEAGAMASMTKGVDLSTQLNGGFFGAIMMRFFGSESLFRNRFYNQGSRQETVTLTQNLPGEIVEQKLANESLYIQAGSFIACTSGVSSKVRWAGFVSWMGGEGLFRLRLTGVGTVWFGAFGSVTTKDIDGEYIVDTGHLLSYPPTIRPSLKLAGGLFGSFFGGEGIVLRLRGKGRILLQTRSVQGFASWLNGRFRG